MPRDVYIRCSCLQPGVMHFLDRICLPNRRWGIVASEAAAVQRDPGIGGGEVQRMADEIVHQDCNSADAQRLAGKRDAQIVNWKQDRKPML